MASKRLLKKQVTKTALRLYNDIILVRAFAPRSFEEENDRLIDELSIWTDDTLRRIAHPDGKNNPKLVHTYYQTLRSDISQRVEDFGSQIDQHLLRIVDLNSVNDNTSSDKQ